jgi:hypothetical protein
MAELIRRSPLTIELVPSTCWYSNVRTNVTKADWEVCKRFVRARSKDRCEICGGRGPRWPVECHEVWSYDDETQMQKLEGLIALCPACHQVKHIGRTSTVGGVEALAQSIKHLCQVNYWSPERAEKAIKIAFEIHEIRSTWQWQLDIDYLQQLGIKTNLQRLMEPRK